MFKRNIIKTGYKVGAIFLPLLAFFNMNFGSTGAQVVFWDELSDLENSERKRDNSITSAIANGSMGVEKAFHLLLQCDSYTQQRILRQMDPEYRQVIERQVENYQKDLVAAMTKFTQEKAKQQVELRRLKNAIAREKGMEELD
ncbi:MAG: hypothetical protein LBF34_03510 [Puniceicoccales bacterium]|jgi:hypothetical protein|nr:hypothetical protein [Puniceicoccales bacterium]